MKRPRADSNEINEVESTEPFEYNAPDDRFGLPHNQEEDSDDSDIELHIGHELNESTLFWDNQLVFHRGKQTHLELKKPSNEHVSEHPFRLSARGPYASKSTPETSKPRSTQFMHRAQVKAATSNLITPSNIAPMKQTRLDFKGKSPATVAPGPQPVPAPQPAPAIHKPMSGQEAQQEEVLDALVSSVCGFEKDSEILPYRLSIQEVFDRVSSKLKSPRRNHPETWIAPQTMNDLSLLKQYTAQLLKPGEYRMGKMDAADLVAKSNHINSDGKHLARRIRTMLNHYRAYGALPLETRGGKREGMSFLDDEHVFAACREWLLAQETGHITPSIFRDAINHDILPRLLVASQKPISIRTARNWLHRLGFYVSKEQKGVYVDGHEREDVLEYRQKVFLPQMEEIDRLTESYHEFNGELWGSPPILKEGEKEHVVFMHDESCFHAYDYKKQIWLGREQQKVPRKSRGKLIHVSDVIGPAGRITKRNAQGEIIRDARKIIYPGGGTDKKGVKKGDAWWNTTQLLEQIKEALDIFEEVWPDCVAVLIFDQSSAHNSYGDGALNAFNLNVKSEGKAPLQKDTYFPPETTGNSTHLRGKLQQLWVPAVDKEGLPVYEDDAKTIRAKMGKGITQILQERGIEIPKGRNGRLLRGKCSKPICQPPIEGEPPKPPCCQARMLQNHEDFREQKSALAQLITDRGHKCIFLPKFHCELNAIEMYWGYCKARYRLVEKFSFDEAKRVAIDALDSCPLDTMRRFCNRSFRFMDAYRKGLSMKAAAWCVKKQKGHRAISEGIMKEFDAGAH